MLYTYIYIYSRLLLLPCLYRVVCVREAQSQVPVFSTVLSLFLQLIFIGVQLLYNLVLVSAVR